MATILPTKETIDKMRILIDKYDKYSDYDLGLISINSLDPPIEAEYERSINLKFIEIYACIESDISKSRWKQFKRWFCGAR